MFSFKLCNSDNYKNMGCLQSKSVLPGNDHLLFLFYLFFGWRGSMSSSSNSISSHCKSRGLVRV